jgi:transposase InsO family protein
MARGFVYLVVVLDWFSRRALSWRVSITLEADFCVEAVEEALARHGKPDIFNTDSKSALPVPGGLTRTAIGRPVGWHREASRGGLTRTLIDQEACLSPDLSAAGNASR